MFPDFKEIATESVLDKPALLDPDKSLRDQMENLFILPLRRLVRYPPLVFVVDALHECTSKAELAELISLLVQVLREPHLPVIHILLMSNSQTHIHEALQQAGAGPLLSKIRASTSGKILTMDVAFCGSSVTGDLPHILAINMEPHNACMTGDLSTAEELLTQEIQSSGVNDHHSHTNRSCVMARKHDWDHALQDALKAVALFNANQHEDAMLQVQQLAAVCPEVDTLVCRVVEAYLCFQLGTTALDGGRHSEAADHFAATVKDSAVTSQLAIHSKYQVFVVIFRWDLESLWKNANQKKCDALLCAGRLGEVVESHRYMMDMSDETMKASCLEWSTGKSSLLSSGLQSSHAYNLAFMRKCSVLYAANGVVELAASGDAALAEKDYDWAIKLYSAAIELYSATDAIFASRSKARLLKMLWEDALLDAEKVIELNPSDYLGYQLKHEALHGAQCYDEAIEAFQIMLLKLDEAPDPQIQKMYQHCISPFEAESTIRQVLHAHLDNAPLHLINTSNGRYKELLASVINNADLQLECIQDMVAKYFHWVMLSHRWGEKEPLLHDIQDKVVYELESVDSITKLQSFCEVSRDAGFLWAWMDTCCIDQKNNVEIQKSVNSMFVCLARLPGVLGIREDGQSKNSWLLKSFFFCRQDWTLYLDYHSTNHKECTAIMEELGDATGIDLRSVATFHPGMRSPREKLQWASTRITTLQEDIAYSLFGIFGVHLPVMYGENKRNTLGQLLQEIVVHSVS
ncbi:hypothetical protein F4604DRAFT_2024111 [Suillus subluteus]|nr:hypothetical protein F4604DRAFT_2024111 [Suillus subluteus]